MSGDPIPLGDRSSDTIGRRAAALVHLARASGRAMSDAQRASGWQAVRSRLRRRRDPRPWRRVTALVAVAFAAGNAVARLPMRERHEVSLQADGSLDPTRTDATAGAPAAVLRFSDGTAITVTPGARVRIAGQSPFVVAVTGTGHGAALPSGRGMPGCLNPHLETAR